MLREQLVLHVASGVGVAVRAIANVGVTVGVTVASGQLQLVCPVQFGLRHELPEQTSPETQSEFTAQLLLHVASGVGVGVAVAPGQLQLVCPEQFGFLQEFPEQTSPDTQFESDEQ